MNGSENLGPQYARVSIEQYLIKTVDRENGFTDVCYLLLLNLYFSCDFSYALEFTRTEPH